MFKRKPKSTNYMQGLLYAEELHRGGYKIKDLWSHLEKHLFMNYYDEFDYGFRDYIRLLKLRDLKNAP